MKFHYRNVNSFFDVLKWKMEKGQTQRFCQFVSRPGVWENEKVKLKVFIGCVSGPGVCHVFGFRPEPPRLLGPQTRNRVRQRRPEDSSPQCH